MKDRVRICLDICTEPVEGIYPPGYQCIYLQNEKKSVEYVQSQFLVFLLKPKYKWKLLEDIPVHFREDCPWTVIIYK